MVFHILSIGSGSYHVGGKNGNDTRLNPNRLCTQLDQRIVRGLRAFRGTRVETVGTTDSCDRESHRAFVAMSEAPQGR